MAIICSSSADVQHPEKSMALSAILGLLSGRQGGGGALLYMLEWRSAEKVYNASQKAALQPEKESKALDCHGKGSTQVGAEGAMQHLGSVLECKTQMAII